MVDDPSPKFHRKEGEVPVVALENRTFAGPQLCTRLGVKLTTGVGPT